MVFVLGGLVKSFLKVVKPSLICHYEGNNSVFSVKEYGYADTLEGHRHSLECAVGWGKAQTLLKFFCEHGLRY